MTLELSRITSWWCQPKKKPDWRDDILWSSVRQDKLEMIRLRHQYVLMWHLRDLQTVKWLILSVSLFKPSCLAATHTHIYPSIYCLTRLHLVQSWVTHSYFLQTHTNTFLMSLSLSWCWLSDKRLFASPPLPFSFPLHSSHVSQVTLSSVPHTHTHTQSWIDMFNFNTPIVYHLPLTAFTLHWPCM